VRADSWAAICCAISKPATVLEISSDSRGPEDVAADLGLDAGGESSPANPPPRIRLEQGIASQLPGASFGGAEERAFAVLGNAGPGDVRALR
jgi:hypothetical protein